MSKISIEQVKHVAHLARLSLTEEKVIQFQKQLDDMIGFAGKLDELNTDNIQPTSYVGEVKNVLREDVSQTTITQEELLQNAPRHQNGQVRVPSIFEV